MTNPKKVEQAALLIAALPPATAARLLSRFCSADILKLFANVPIRNFSVRGQLQEAVEQLEKETRRQFGTNRPCLNRSNGSLSESNVDRFVDRDSELSFLVSLDPEMRCRVLERESPSDIAKAISLLPPKTASETLSRFDAELRGSVIDWICKSEEISPEDVTQLKLALEQNLSQFQRLSQYSGLTLAISKKLLPTSERLDGAPLGNLQEGVLSKPVDSARKIASRGIEHLTALTDAEIKVVLQHTDTSLWAPTLRNEADSNRQRLYDCMAPAPVALLRIEIEQLDKVTPDAEEIARRKVVATIVKLAAQGKIMTGRPTDRAAA
jgi:flagellar motor switch protein FliG